MLIDYNMTRDYCSDWTAIDALREMVQNAIDSTRTFDCDCDKHEIEVTTHGVTLTPKMFAMGYSLKSGTSIGGYGEGFKLGMMILTREGLNPVIYTGKYKVKGEFKVNEVTETETFCLVFTEQDKQETDTTFLCSPGSLDLEELKRKVTPFSERPLPEETTVGILYTRPGMIYVNGLFVCEEPKLVHGYNFSPSRISLNRDRNMVSGVESQLGSYYADYGNAEHILTLIENDARDVSYLQYYLYSNNKLKAELARLFHNKYGEGATIGKPGQNYYGGFYSHVSMSSAGYSTMRVCGIKPGVEVVDPNSPLGLLTTFVSDNKKHMRSKAIQNCNTLLNQAKAWRNK